MTIAIKTHRNILVSILIGFVLCSATLLSTPEVAYAACPATLPTNTGKVTTTLQIPSTGNYKIWSRIKSAGSNANSYYLRVNSTCFEVGNNDAIPTNAWTWVDYQNGNQSSKITMNLNSGSHIVELIGAETNVGVDKLLAVTNHDCVPTGFGDNCGSAQPPEPADLVVESITMNPATPVVGDAVTFSAVIRNQGTGATTIGINHGVRFRVGTQVVSWSGGNNSVSIPAGGTHTFVANNGPTGGVSIWTATQGTHTVEAFVDDQGVITESNNNNNVLTRSVTVNAAPVDPCATAPLGDVDCDGSVGGSDFLTIRNNTRRVPPISNPTRQDGDIYVDGVVDGKDFALFLTGLRQQNASN